MSGLDTEAEAFRQSFLNSALAARDGHRAAVRDLSIAGESVRLTVADDDLARRLLPAFEHIGGTEQPPTVELIAWTDRTSPAGPQVLPWEPGRVEPRGGVDGLLEGPVRSAAAHDGSSLILWDDERRTAACWWRDLTALPYWEAGAPLRVALHYALRRPDRMLIHAACVGSSDVGVLLVGPGGTGKSTTTAACLEAGLHSVGEDYLVLDTSGPAPRAHTLYRTVKVTPGLTERTNDRERRQTLLVGDDLAGTMASSLRIGAVIVPRIVNTRTSSVTELHRARGLRALLPTTLFQVPRESRPDLTAIHRLLTSTPCYELALGADRGVTAIGALLERLR
jgi:hypothetical protein